MSRVVDTVLSANPVPDVLHVPDEFTGVVDLGAGLPQDMGNMGVSQSFENLKLCAFAVELEQINVVGQVADAVQLDFSCGTVVSDSESSHKEVSRLGKSPVSQLCLFVLAVVPVFVQAATATLEECEIVSSGSSGGTNATTPALSTTPDAGDLLVARFGIDGEGGGTPGAYTFSCPSGFTKLQEYVNTNTYDHQGFLCAKIAAGTESSGFQFTWGDGDHFGYTGAVCRWSSSTGSFETAEDSGEDTSNVSSNATSHESGSVTNTTADSFIVAPVSAMDYGDYNGTQSCTSSFTLAYEAAPGSLGAAAIGFCTLEVSSASTYSTTFDTDDTATAGYGTIASFPFTASDSTPPSYTSVPAVSTKTSTSVTIAATATDDSGPIDHYCSAYSDGSSTPSASNIKSGAGTGYVTSSNASDLNVTSGNAASVVVGNLSAETAYDIYCVAEDDAANLSASGSKVDVTTPASVDGVPILVEDGFTDANDTSIAAHTPDTDESGNGWEIVDIWTGQASSTATIQSNQLEVSEQTAVVIDVGTPDMVVDVDYTPATGETNRAGLPIRYVDSDDYWECRYIPATGNINLLRRVSDVSTDYGTQAFAFTLGQTYRLTAFANGNNIGCAIDGVPKVFVTDSTFNTATKGGVAAEAVSAAQQFDDLVVLQSFNAINPNTGDVADDQKGFFFGQPRQSGDVYWMDPDDLVDNSPETLLLYYGGSFYIDPQTDYAGATQWGLELYDSVLNTISTSSHTHTTVVPGFTTEEIEAVQFENCGDGTFRKVCP